MSRGRLRASCAALLAGAAVSAALVWAPAGAGSRGSASAGAGEGFEVLVFTRTTGFRHVSIPGGIAAIRALGSEHGFGVDATEDPAAFTRRNLKRYEAVIFLNTTGTVLEDRGRRAMMRYVRGGGGFVGIHSAADTEYDWPFYERLVGAYFLSHPIQQTATFHNAALDNPATSHLPRRFEVFDEFYSFRTNPRPNVRVLLTIDETTYSPDPNTTNLPGGTPTSGYMGDHPMSWCHRDFRGRAFYTALGHENYLYELGWFREHLLGGILTAAKQVKSRCGPRR